MKLRWRVLCGCWAMGCQAAPGLPEPAPAPIEVKAEVAVVAEVAVAAPSVAGVEGRDEPPKSPEAALEALLAGNRRFMTDQPRHPHALASFRAGLKAEQRPFATILSCSDSRVPPELVFDEGFGDLFVVRVAGNIVDVDVAGSIEYAVAHLHTPLLGVMGHENCGAVTAALQHFRGELGTEPPEILALLRHIEPGLEHRSRRRSLAEQTAIAVEDNVRHSVRELLHVPHIRRAVAAGRLQVVGMLYDLDTGEVRVLP